MIGRIKSFSFILSHTTSNSYSPVFHHLTPPKCASFPPQPWSNHRLSSISSFHTSSVLLLNRFLFDPSEINSFPNEEDDTNGSPWIPSVTLPKSDYRTIHAAKILNLQNGDKIRAGIVGEASSDHHELNQRTTNHQDNGIRDISQGGVMTDDAIISWIPEGKIKKAQPTKNGEPPGSLQIDFHSLSPPLDNNNNNHKSHTSRTPIFPSDYSVSLILALPRPLQLGRMLPMMAQMGVDHLVLTSAKKVPKDYFGSHLFRKPQELQHHLIEGLCQAGDVRLPKVTVVKRLKIFVEDELDSLFPSDQYAKVIAHPLRRTSRTMGKQGEEAPTDLRMRNIQFPEHCERPKLVIAVGPEGGWEEDYELELFQSHGFEQVTLGNRILRSDVAVVSLLSLAHDVCVDQVYQHWNTKR